MFSKSSVSSPNTNNYSTPYITEPAHSGNKKTSDNTKQSQSILRRASDFAATAFLGSNPENTGGINGNGYVTKGVPLFGQKRARLAENEEVSAESQKPDDKGDKVIR
jgi:hypothetical protein